MRYFFKSRQPLRDHSRRDWKKLATSKLPLLALAERSKSFEKKATPAWSDLSGWRLEIADETGAFSGLSSSISNKDPPALNKSLDKEFIPYFLLIEWAMQP